MPPARNRRLPPIDPILFVIALGAYISPPLDIGGELARIHAEQQESPFPLRVVSPLAPRLQDLQPYLLKVRPAMIHVATHGDPDGSLCGLSLAGTPAAIPAAAFRRLIAGFPSVRLVVLAACHSDALARDLAEVVDVAIGMRGPISDNAASAFSVAFYRALAYHYSVDAAFEQGVAAIGLEDFSEADRPQLHTRAGMSVMKLRVA